MLVLLEMAVWSGNLALHSNQSSDIRFVVGGNLNETLSNFFFLGSDGAFSSDSKEEFRSGSLPRYTSVEESLTRPTMFKGRDFIGVDVRSSSEEMSITRSYPFIAAEEDCICKFAKEIELQ